MPSSRTGTSSKKAAAMSKLPAPKPTHSLPAAITAQLPPTTPLRNVSRLPQEIEAQRGAITALVETVLDGYWQADMSQKKRDLILMDWADELEEWPVESVKAALRQWRRENPSKKPNPGHILELLNKAWGARNAGAVRAAMADRAPAPRLIPEAQRRAQVAEMARLFPDLPLKVLRGPGRDRQTPLS